MTKLTLTITDSIREKLLDAEVVTLDLDPAAINQIKAEALRAMGSYWDMDEDLTGQDVYDMTKDIADKLVGVARLH